eukprot:scaffold62711_cov55-Phaeocystis_antarctica.AAC.2
MNASHLRLVGLGPAGVGDARSKVACLALGHAQQRQFLRLRLLPRLLTLVRVKLSQRRRRRCSPLRRRLPLRRPRDAQRRLLGGGEVAQVHVLGPLAAAVHTRLVGLWLASIEQALLQLHAEVTRPALGHAQSQPLRLRLLPRLIAGQRQSLLRLLPRLLTHRRPQRTCS